MWKKCTIIGAQFISVGKNTRIGEDSKLIAVNHHFQQKLVPCLVIGEHVRATSNLQIMFAGTIIIENHVLLGPDCFIIDHNHGINPDLPGGYSPQPLSVKNIRIKEGCWLGNRVTVLPGVTIGEHCVIGAGSIVTHDIPAFCMAVGNPARVIKKWDANEKRWIVA